MTRTNVIYLLYRLKKAGFARYLLASGIILVFVYLVIIQTRSITKELLNRENSIRLTNNLNALSAFVKSGIPSLKLFFSILGHSIQGRCLFRKGIKIRKQMSHYFCMDFC